MIQFSRLLRFLTVTSIATLNLAYAAPTTNCLPYLSTPPDQKSMVAPHTEHQTAKKYILPATPATTQWGVFDSQHTPVLHIKSGDSIVIETMAASDDQVVPGGANLEQIIKMKDADASRGPHTLTGPIYVEGAEPGDVLKIHLNKIVPRPYASNDAVPGKGLFPEKFPHGYVKYFYLDLKKMQMPFSPGIVVPLAPFPGVIAVARSTPGKYDSIPPGPFGGNMDLRELTEGSTLYLPVFMQGALLWTGDSHAGQGNGEIDLTAIETAFSEFDITVDVVKNKSLTWPRVETKTDWIAVGYDKNINKAFDILKEETIKLIVDERHLSNSEAEKFMYQTWNCPIAEVVNGVQGVYCMVPKHGNVTHTLPKEDNDKFFVTYAKNADLEQAMKTASMAMLEKMMQVKKMSAVDAYTLASVAMDCRIGPYKSGDKEVHCMLAKNLWV